MTSTSSLHIIRRVGIAAMATTAALASVGADRVAADVIPATPVAADPGRGQSEFRCHIELDVRFKGHRFESFGRSESACVGLLLGRPMVGGVRPRATGLARPLHWGSGLPPVFGPIQLQATTVGPAVPIGPRDHARLKMALSPQTVSTVGAGAYTGTAQIRGRTHNVSGTSVFVPRRSKGSNLCCSTGRLILDMSVSTASM